MRTAAVATPLAFAALLLAPPVPANHPQSGDGTRVAFAPWSGGEWWVETPLIGASQDKVVAVQARDDNTNWKELEWKSYGTWAGSVHIEPGNRVRYRALFADGDAFVSCQFLHPGIDETCNENTPASAFRWTPAEDAIFDHRGGNEWWVEVDSWPRTGQVDRVSARVEGDATWHPLKFRSWGVWAGSIHVPPGTRVQFEAAQAGGTSDVWRQVSCWFTHPAGLERCEGGPGPGLEAEFHGVGGSEWWVQTSVTTSKVLAGVDARVDDTGAWKPLTFRSWGAWAASIHVPDGSIVEFRARAVDGSWDMSEGAWLWPAKEPYPQPGDLDVRFHNLRGGEWWIGVNVHANEPVAAVNLREDPGHYETLRLEPWGDWARGIHLEPGHRV